MTSVKSETKSTLRKFVYGDLDRDGLSRKIKHIEHHTEGANPHNIGMAASGYLVSSSANDEVKSEAKEVIISVFPTKDMKRVFAHDVVDEIKNHF